MNDPAALHAALRPVQQLLSSGKKIQAIKALRELTHLGLKDAKDAVEHFADHGQWRPSDLRALPPQQPVSGEHMTSSAAEAPSTSVAAMEPTLDHALQPVEQLARSGKKIQAIKALREVSGLGLKEAKDAVEHFMTHGQWRPSDLQPIQRLPDPAIGQLESTPFNGEATNQLQASWSSPIAAPRTHTDVPLRSTNAARAALTERLGPAETPLIELHAESGLYQGQLFVTSAHVAFVADRFGRFEVTECIPRADIDDIEVQRDPFGADLIVRTNLHSAHFSELDEQHAEALRDFLSGRINELPKLAPDSASETRSAGPEFPSPTANSAFDFQSVPAEQFQPSAPTPQSNGSAPFLAETAPRFRFSLVRVAFHAVFAALPAVLVGSLWRFISLEGFPEVAYQVMYWSAVAVGGGLVRGRVGTMLQAGFIAGLLHWGLGNLLAQYTEARLLGLALLGIYSVKAWPSAGYLWGALLVLPAMLIESLLGLHVMVFDTHIPTLAFSFWFAAFAVEDLRRNKKASEPSPS